MAINEIDTTTPLVGLKPAAEIINNNFTNSDNAASKAVQSSVTDFTTDRVMLTDGTGQAATLGNYMTVGGTANAITLTSQYAKPITALVTGMQFRFKASAQNTGAVTIAVDGLTPVAGTTVTGAACPADYIRNDVETVITYNGTGFTVDPAVAGDTVYTSQTLQPFEFNGIGIAMLVKNNSGGVISSNSNFTGPNAKAVYFTSVGDLLEAPGALTGVWRNIGGGSFSDGQTFQAVKISN